MYRPLNIQLDRLPILSLLIFSALGLIAPSQAKAQIPKTILHSFQTDTPGITPQADLILGQDGLLYGTTYGCSRQHEDPLVPTGPEEDGGTLFRIHPDGSGFQTLHPFHFGSEGCRPACLILGQDGLLYGVTEGVDAAHPGTLFTIHPDGTAFQTLYRFSSSQQGAIFLVQGRDGSFFGITRRVGTTQPETLFQLTLQRRGFKVLHRFNRVKDGAWPTNLILGHDGNLYGTTFGGAYYAGAIFKTNPDGRGYRLVHHFNKDGEGETPESFFTEGRDGKLYGMAIGSQKYYIVYSLNTDGSDYRVLHRFYWPDEEAPSGLVEGSDGLLYGTAYPGGAKGYGIVYKMSTEGAHFEKLGDFAGQGTDGADPIGNLVEGPDGNLYGVTQQGGIGTNSCGCIFKLQTQIRSQAK